MVAFFSSYSFIFVDYDTLEVGAEPAAYELAAPSFVLFVAVLFGFVAVSAGAVSLLNTKVKPVSNVRLQSVVRVKRLALISAVVTNVIVAFGMFLPLIFSVLDLILRMFKIDSFDLYSIFRYEVGFIEDNTILQSMLMYVVDILYAMFGVWCLVFNCSCGYSIVIET